MDDWHKVKDAARFLRETFPETPSGLLLSELLNDKAGKYIEAWRMVDGVRLKSVTAKLAALGHVRKKI